MSSRDCTTLEGFIEDCLFGNSCKLHVMLITNLLEYDHKKEFHNIRESIEYNINFDFDEENQSWRGYRNSLCYYYDAYNTEIDEILNEQSKVTLAVNLLCKHYTLYQRTVIITALNQLPKAECDIAKYLEYCKDIDTKYEDFVPSFRSWFRTHFLDKLNNI